MAKTIFTNQTANIETTPFAFRGKMQVNVSGVLDGADVKTYFKGADSEATLVRTCSWLSSQGDTLGVIGETADGGYDEVIAGSNVFFKIENVGASTDINLEFYADWYDD